MSLFAKFFGFRSALERQLYEIYSHMLIAVGYKPKQAQRLASKAIRTLRRQGKIEGTADLPEDYGDRLIETADLGEPLSNKIVERARQEGATDDDIREWWNLPDLCRRMVLWSENIFRYSVFSHAIHCDGRTTEEAALRVHKMYPIYGQPDKFKTLTGENRPLPHELRGRVDAYKEAHGAELIKEQVKHFPSYNAFVRNAITEGKL